MPASPDQYRKEREYTPGGDLLFHASVGPSGAMTISGSQAAFVPVRRKGWHAGLMNGGWVSLYEHFTGQLGQEAEDGRYPAGPATWTFRTARGGGVHLEFSVPHASLIEARSAAHSFDIRRRPFCLLVALRGPAGQPVPLLVLRASPDERDALLSIGHPFYAPRADRDRIGVRLTGDTDWEEIRELVTDNCRRLAPKKLTASLDQQRHQ